MKVSEFKKLEEAQQLDELGLSSFIGDFGAAAVKSIFSGKGLKHQMVQDMFLKDFYEDGITSLENAIKGGLVDPNIRGTDLSGGAGATEQDPESVSPTAGAVAASKAQRQTIQDINNYVKSTAAEINKATDKNQKIQLTKELVNSMADRQGTPEWDNAVKGVEKIIKNAGLDTGTTDVAIKNLRAGKIMSEAWRIYAANKLVEAVGLTWKDLGLCVLKENNNFYVADRKYIKLNSLFESIINLNEDDGKQSISQYMMNWFNQYMTGVNWQPQKQLILNTLTDLENTYPKGYKEKIKTLANTAYALSKSSTSMPLGMKDELSKLKNNPTAQAAAKNAGVETGEGPATDTKAAPTADELVAQIQQLAKTDPTGYNKVLASLKPTTAPAPTTSDAAPAPTPPTPPTAPAPTTTAESRRRRK